MSGKKIILTLTKRQKKLKEKYKKPPKVKNGQSLLFPHNITNPEIIPGWKEIISANDIQEFYKNLDKTIKARGPTTRGSHHFGLKLNGGFGQNKETGLTISGNFTGQLDHIFDILSSSGVEELKPSRTGLEKR